MADKRLTPARPDLAASSLKGQVEAARFVDGEEAAVAWGRVSLRAGPSYDSGQVSELLFGETVTVYERKDGWAWLQAKTDSYVGYARESGLGPPVEADAHVIQLLTPLLSAPDVKSPLRDLLPLNAPGQPRAAGRKISWRSRTALLSARVLAPLADARARFCRGGRTLHRRALCLGRQDLPGVGLLRPDPDRDAGRRSSLVRATPT